MRYEQTVAPTGQPVTAADAKTHGVIVTDDDDSYLAGLIAKATRYIERLAGRQMLTSTWVARMEGFPGEIELRILPVTAVVSITYVDDDAVTQTLVAVTDYQVDCEDPDSPARICPAYGTTWPSVRGETYNSVVVTFTAGYGTAASVPVTYKHAILLLVQHWYENREPVNIGNIVNPLPFTIQSLMAAEAWGSYA